MQFVTHAKLWHQLLNLSQVFGMTSQIACHLTGYKGLVINKGGGGKSGFTSTKRAVRKGLAMLKEGQVQHAIY